MQRVADIPQNDLKRYINAWRKQIFTTISKTCLFNYHDSSDDANTTITLYVNHPTSKQTFTKEQLSTLHLAMQSDMSHFFASQQQKEIAQKICYVCKPTMPQHNPIIRLSLDINCLLQAATTLSNSLTDDNLFPADHFVLNKLHLLTQTFDYWSIGKIAPLSDTEQAVHQNNQLKKRRKTSSKSVQVPSRK